MEGISYLDFHLPQALLGQQLSAGSRVLYRSLKASYKTYATNSEPTVNEALLLGVLDQINSITGNADALKILETFFEYLRIKLLSSDLQAIVKAALCADFLVKNSGYYIHHCAENKFFVKTLSLVGRRLLQHSQHGHRQVGLIIIDILQGWGEGFESRRVLYPNIYNTFINLKFKYRVQFMRPDYDSNWVPIFLGPVSRIEYNVQRGTPKRQDIAHHQAGTASGEEVKSISPADAVAQVSADVFHKLPVSVFIFVR